MAEIRALEPHDQDALEEFLRAEGVGAAVLFTGDDNVSAVRAYAALGFRRIGDYRVVLLREAV